MNEFELIHHYFNRAELLDHGDIGIGDDCALLSVAAGQQLAVSIDTLVEGIHFPHKAAADEVGERLLRTALSDLAAVGAKPKWFTLALTLPDSEAHWLAAFSEGLFRVAKQYNCALVGGDTTRGPLTLTVQVHGEVPVGKAITRDGAGIGDWIFVSGPLAEGAAGLQFVTGQLASAATLNSTQAEYLQHCFYRPEPQIKLGLALQGLATSAIDISDGLIADLSHICCASKVGAKIRLEDLPYSETVVALFNESQRRKWALTGGDEYQLCFTVADENIGLFQEKMKGSGFSCFHIGYVTENIGMVEDNQGNVVRLSESGYQHF